MKVQQLGKKVLYAAILIVVLLGGQHVFSLVGPELDQVPEMQTPIAQLDGVENAYAWHGTATPDCVGTTGWKVTVVDVWNGYQGLITASENLEGNWSTIPQTIHWSVTVAWPKPEGGYYDRPWTESGTMSTEGCGVYPPTKTPVPSFTPTTPATSTFTETATSTATTVSVTPSYTPTITETATNTATATPSFTATNTLTATSTSTGTITATYTPSITPTSTITSTATKVKKTKTPAPTATFVPVVATNTAAPAAGPVCPPQFDKIVTLNPDFTGTVIMMDNLKGVSAQWITIVMPERSKLVGYIFDGKECKIIFAALLPEKKVSDLFEVGVYGGVPRQLTNNTVVNVSEPQYMKHEEGFVLSAEYQGTEFVIKANEDGSQQEVLGEGHTPSVAYDDTINFIDVESDTVTAGGENTDLAADRILWDPQDARWLVVYGAERDRYLQDYTDIAGVLDIPQGVDSAFQPAGTGYVTLNEGSESVTIYELIGEKATAIRHDSYLIKPGAIGVIWIRGNNELSTRDIALNLPPVNTVQEVALQPSPTATGTAYVQPATQGAVVGSYTGYVIAAIGIVLTVLLADYLIRRHFAKKQQQTS